MEPDPGQSSVSGPTRPPPLTAAVGHPLRLARQFTHFVAYDNACALLADDDVTVLHGQGVAELIQLLDGRACAGELADVLAGRFSREVTHFTLLKLQAAGLVEAVDRVDGAELTGLAADLHTTWSNRGSLNAVITRVVTEAGALRLVMTDDLLRPDLIEVVSESMRVGELKDEQGGTPSENVLLVRLGSWNVWLGPQLGEAGSGVCSVCLQSRVQANMVGRVTDAVPRQRRSSKQHATPVLCRADQTIPYSAFRALAWALGRWVDGTQCVDVAKGIAVFSLDADGGAPEGSALVRFHAVHALAGCDACRQEPQIVSSHAPNRVHPVSAPSTSPGYRMRTSREAWDEYARFIDPVTGVVRRVEPVDSCDGSPIHVFASSFVTPEPGRARGFARMTSGGQTSGKGSTEYDARMSALGESLERYSAVHRGCEPGQPARMSGLGSRAIHPNAVQCFSESQFADREAWNSAQANHFHYVPHPYADEIIDWTPVRSLTECGDRWAPSALLYLGYCGEGNRFCKGDSNGLAGGSCLEEAMLQGLLELIERDAVAAWWYNRSRVPALTINADVDRYLFDTLGHYRGIGRSVWALDLTTDLGIPVIAALSRLEGTVEEDIIFGFGAHVDPALALRRAVSELNQMLPSVNRTQVERESLLMPDFAEAIRWWQEARVESLQYLTPSPNVSPASGAARERVIPATIDEALDHCTRSIAAAGMEVFMYELTRPELGYSVVKMLAPGLRHFWRRTGPGRLYDVPSLAGWTGDRLEEAELHPISIFV